MICMIKKMIKTEEQTHQELTQMITFKFLGFGNKELVFDAAKLV